jgi:hypothetical protein
MRIYYVGKAPDAGANRMAADYIKHARPLREIDPRTAWTSGPNTPQDPLDLASSLIPPPKAKVRHGG